MSVAAERIKEEIRGGKKSIDGAIKAGFERGLTPVVDGNVTVIIVAVILMGVFGSTNNPLGKLLTALFGSGKSSGRGGSGRKATSTRKTSARKSTRKVAD